jgi:ATP-dependent exoDNAse (exonuclease V) beta subunit
LDSERGENGRSITYFETKEFPEEKAAENEALKAEGQRLVYVAATRARNALILYNRTRVLKGKESVDSKWSPITESGHPDLLWYVEQHFGEENARNEETITEVAASSIYIQAEGGSALNKRKTEAASFQTETPSNLHLVSKIDDAGNESVSAHDLKDEEFSGKKRFPALLGTMMHKLMEMLVSARNGIDAKSSVTEIIR